MTALRSLLYSAIFYPVTVAWVLVGMLACLLDRRAILAVVVNWVEFHHWLLTRVLGIRISVDGEIPPGPPPDRRQAPVDAGDDGDGAGGGRSRNRD